MVDFESVASWDEFVVQVRLLIAAERATEAERYEALMIGEARHELWASSGHTYPKLIEVSGLGEAARYVGYKRARERMSIEQIREIGVAAAIVAARLPTDEQCREVIAESRAFVDANSYAPPERTARTFARSVAARAAGAETAGTPHRSYEALLAEVKVLRSRCAEQEQTIAALRAEIKTLRAKRSKPAPQGSKAA